MLATHTAPSPVATDRGPAAHRDVPVNPVAPWIHPRHGVVTPVRDPHPPVVDRDVSRPVADGDPDRIRALARVEAQQLVGAVIRDPDRAEADGDRDRLSPDPDWLAGAVPGGVDGVDGLRPRARHPDGRAADGDAAGAVGDLDRRLRVGCGPAAGCPSEPSPPQSARAPATAAATSAVSAPISSGQAAAGRSPQPYRLRVVPDARRDGLGHPWAGRGQCRRGLPERGRGRRGQLSG